ncbi:zinc finger, CCHC-type containing protein [Tanacetum coccineum]
MDSIMGNNTWVLADLPPGCKPLGCKWIFKRKLKVDETIEKFKARLVIHGFKQKSRIYYFDTYALFGTYQYHKTADCYGINSMNIHPFKVDLTKEFLSSRFSMKDIVSTPMDTSEKLMPNDGQAVSQLEYSRVIGCLMYVVPTGRVIATVSIKVPAGRYIVPADYIVPTGRTN